MKSLLTRFERARVVSSSINSRMTAFKVSTQKRKLRRLLLLVIVGAIGFWASIGQAQTSCGELTLFLYNEAMGDIGGCDQGSQYHTWVYRYEFLPYSSTDPLLVTFTGGKTTVGEPYYPSYETTSGSCEADRDKYSPTITLTFNKPVANFRTRLAHYMNQAINYTVTANNGATATVSLAPFQGQPGNGTVKEVILPGDNITAVTITPNSFGPNGEWRFLVYHDIYITTPTSYTNCNCNRSTFPRPAPETVSSSWPGAFGPDPNWNMQVNVSDQDGLVLSNVKLGQRYLAEKISVPYFYLETSALAPTRGELKPDGSETLMRSRLVNYYVQKDADKLVIEAQYVIDKIPAASLSCLQITQRYEFYNTKPGDQCEPSGKLPCSRWKPIVKYQFFGRNGEFLKSLNIAQRQHRMVDGNPYNTVGLFKDSDSIGELLGTGLFSKKYNPLTNEWYDPIITKGKSANQWDNVHQTFARVVEEPGIDWTFQNWDPRRPGCPECFHSHWRWGSITGGEGRGNIIGIPAGSNQDLDFAIVTNQAGEEHPQNRFSDIVNGLVQYWQPIRTFNTAGRNPLQIYRHSAPEDVVFWQSGTGYQHRDTFFAYGGFFNPALATRQLYTRSSGSGLMAESVRSKLSTEFISSEDGLASITAELIFSHGETTPIAFDPALAGPFAEGYAPYNNLSYDIETTSESSGPFTVTFDVPSVSDQATFDNLRIFHLEQDQFDPTKIVWVDRTVLAPDPNQPDFTNRTISARVSTLGQLVVGTLIAPQPPITAVANIAVTTNDSPDSVVAGNNLTYTVNVTNNGPQNATGIELTSALSPQVRFISVNPSQGTCAEEDSIIVCKLNQLTSISTAVVTIVVKPTDEGSAIPPGGRVITNTVFAKAVEIDTNLTDNTATETTTVLPESNIAPTISITSPSGGSLFVGPATITIDLTASDADGSVSAVEVYANGEPIGSANSAGGGLYTLTWNNVDFGSHTLIATARDNQNRIGVSAPIYLTVNGAATVNITSPTNLAMITTQDVVVTANALITGATIDKVDFYADGFAFVGSGTLSGPDQYTLTWVSPSAGSHNLVAVATDSNGVTTTSGSVTFTVNDAPSLNFTSPVNGALYHAPASIPLSVTANDSDGSVQRVEVLANGQVIRTFNANIFTSQFNSTWSNVAAGEYTMTAAVTDQQGAVTTSPPVQVTVNALPTVNITSPAAGSVFNAPANVTLVANGQTGNATVASADTMNWGKPNANAVVIGTVVNDTAKTLVFAYETGAVMPGLTAPARRVGFFMHDATALNANGTALLDSAIRWAIGGGSVTGSFATSPVGSLDLTAEGIVDWAHWGRGGPTAFDHKAGVTQRISNFTKIGTAGLSWFTDCPTMFSWTDGTPTVSATNTATGVNTSGIVGNGFEITVPADSNPKTLRVYGGVWYTQSKLEVSLSDGSAPSFVNTSLSNNGGASFGVYTITFKAGSPGQTLKVRYTILNQYFSPNGNVALEAATLR